MKRVISMFLIFIIVFSSVSCARKDENPSNGENPIPTEKAFSIATDAVKGGKLFFVKDMQSEYKIVLSQNSSEVEKYAAEFLYDIVEDATGTKLSTIHDNDVSSFNKNDYFISIGNTSMQKSEGPEIKSENLNVNGFVLSLSGNTVFIAGNNEMGTLYGVQEFLKYVLDFEVYGTDEIYYNKVSTAHIINFGTLEVAPSIRYCSPGAIKAEILENAALLRSCSRRKWWGTLSGTLWSSKLIAHSLPEILPQASFPNWYNNGQICYSNKDAMTYIADRVTEIIEAAPKSEIFFQLGNGDSKKACGCKDCQAQAINNGGYGGSYVIWLNQIAAKIEDKLFTDGFANREWYLLGLMYQAYESAPVKYNQTSGKYEPLNSNVICGEHVGVQFCPISACFSHPMDSDNCKFNVEGKTAQNLYGWAALTDTYLLWTYETDFYNFLFVFDNFGSLTENIRTYTELGVQAIYYQMCSNVNSPFDAFRAYLITQLSWDSSLEYEVLFKKFFENYYKEAAPYMTEYFNAIQANMHATGEKIGNKGCLVYYNGAGQYSDAKYWTFSLLQNYEKILDKAYAAIEQAGYNNEQKEIMRLRIRADEMFCENYFVRNYVSYYSAEEYEVLCDSYYKDLSLLGITKLGEGVGI